MGLHDTYIIEIGHAEEYEQYKTDENLEINDKFYEEFKRKYKFDFKLNDKYTKKLKDALPKEYHPSQSRIDEQKKVSEKLHEEIFSTHFNYFYKTKFGRIYESYSNTDKDRGTQAFLGYLSYYGTDENRTKLDEISQKIFDCQCKLKKAEKSKNPDAIDEAEEALYDAREEMDKFVKGVLVDELKRAVKEVPRVMDLMTKADTPEKILENYREVRQRFMFMGESDGFFESYKKMFDKNEISEMKATFGKVHGKGIDFLNRAGNLANPMLAGNFDMEEMKMISSEKLNKISFDLNDWDIYNTSKLKGETQEAREKDERGRRGEASAVRAFTEGKTTVFVEWESDIKSYYGTGKGNVKIMDLDGDIRELTEDVMSELYEEGAPFWAINTESNRAEAVLCMPTEDHRLAIGKEEIDKIETGELKSNLNRPSSAKFALDSFISFFNSNWRVKEVKKYEDELAIHEKRVALRYLGEKAKKMVRDPRYKAETLKFAHKVIMEEKPKSLKVEEAKIAQEAKEAGKTVEEYVKNYGKIQKEKLAKIESEDIKKKVIEDAATQRNQLIGKLKSTEMPKHNVRRIRLAYEKADSAVGDELLSKNMSLVKYAASLMIRNIIKSELETVLSTNNMDVNRQAALAQYCKARKPESVVTKNIKNLASDKKFIKFVEGLTDKNKIEYFDTTNAKEQDDKIVKFINDFIKYKDIDDRTSTVIKSHELNSDKHIEPKPSESMPKDLNITGIKPTNIL